MTALESMRGALRETGLYRLDGSTSVDAELFAYAQELDALHADLDDLERESFAATATGRGLMLWEAAYGLSGEGRTTAQRREAVLGRAAVRHGDFTAAGVERVLLASGYRARVYEEAGAASAGVCFLDPVPDPVDRYRARALLRGFWPAHLGAELDYRDLAWKRIDGMELRFAAMDARGYSWNQIDRYGNAVLPLDDA